MYFAIGGRKVQSGLYRVTYVGNESTAPVQARDRAITAERGAAAPARSVPRQGRIPAPSTTAWPYLGHPRPLHPLGRAHRDRASAGRRPGRTRRSPRPNPAKQLEALLALARVTGIDPVPSQARAIRPWTRAMQAQILAALLRARLGRARATTSSITLVRTYEIVFNRFGRPDERHGRAHPREARSRASRRPRCELNWLLCETLVYLQSPTVAAKAIALIAAGPDAGGADRIRALAADAQDRLDDAELRTAYFEWFLKAANYRGGASFDKFIEFIRNDAVASLSDAEKTRARRRAREEARCGSRAHRGPRRAASRAARRTTWTLDELAPPPRAG